MRKKVSTTVYLDPDQFEKLKALSAATRVPWAVYVREGVDLALERHTHEIPGEQQSLRVVHDIKPRE